MSLRTVRRLLVTGGAGFIGSHFISYTLRNIGVERVVNFDALTYAGDLSRLRAVEGDSRYRFVRGDICAQELIEQLLFEEKIDTVVHFAAESHVDRSIEMPLAFARTNVLGTATLLEAVRRFPKVHFHHISTDEVFGEGEVYNPSSPYSASKAASDHFVRAYGRTYGLLYTLSYGSNTYGPGQNEEKLIPRCLCSCYEKTAIPLYGTGANMRRWLYVEDHVRAIWKILGSAPTGSVYAIGGGEERSNLSLAQLLTELYAEIVGEPRSLYQELITFVPDRPGHDFRYALGKELPFVPEVSLREGLLLTIQSFLQERRCQNFHA